MSAKLHHLDNQYTTRECPVCNFPTTHVRVMHLRPSTDCIEPLLSCNECYTTSWEFPARPPRWANDLFLNFLGSALALLAFMAGLLAVGLALGGH